MTAPYVLVHGAWHTGDHWEPIADRLRRAGHTVHTPTVAGFGEGADPDVTHADGVDSIVRYVADRGLHDFVLVGHSFGGTIISKVAEAMPERIRRLVFWNAFVLENGNSINDESPASYREMVRGSAVDGRFSLPWPVWREAFLNDADEPTARAAFETLCPTPVSMLEDKLDLAKFHELIAAGRLRCSYLNCTEDIAMPHGEYAWHPRFSSRLGLCRIVQMPGSHEVLFTQPDALAAKIIEAGRD
ncbi:alpha/beta fold hydrolase [Amycolatopsis sp. GA6-003]|uniref:alpha/beta fold hydrolase n=1 Tax=Amycolatopsis sp. GA6-003 TaxID=2652444 RepID=UPI0039171969